ncbi:MAG TPA: CopD family protein [Candidatus Ruania gallistercoris]|uniref:CopD family protein n=1 Tax=Candidatus Ruania gallistercoris TaxID=2838746 RepID=A0A9D2EF29_9MICO|nr:CopD family protein [Candidatus Ruania gallistercoris]
MSTFDAGTQVARPPVGGLLRWLVAIIATGVMLVIGAPAASAHAELVGSTPQDGAALDSPPGEVVLTFNEPVQLLDGGIRLFPGGEDPVELDARVRGSEVIAAVPGELGEGSFALSYRVISADGHPITGALSFTVGGGEGSSAAPAAVPHTPRATEVALGVLTAIHYLTLLSFVGLVCFERVIMRTSWPPGGRALRVRWWIGIAAVLAPALLIPVSALNVTALPLTAIGTPSHWWPGVLAAPVTTAGLVLLGVAVTLIATRRNVRGRLGRVATTTAPLLALVAPVLVGHTQLVQPRPVIVVADISHLAAGSFWTGGVLGLLLFLADQRRRERADSREPTAATSVVDRFSSLAVWSVLLLALSGTLMAVMIIDDLDALFSTAYGRTLLVKVGVVALVVAVAGYNRLRLLPRLATRTTARQQWQLLTRTLTAEAALLATVLSLTGFLVTLSPTHEDHSGAAEVPAATAETTALDAAAQGLEVDGVLEPAATGDNRMMFSLRYEGEPVSPDEVIIRALLSEQDLGPFDIVPELDPDTGEYTAELPLPVAGTWDVQVSVRVSTFAEPVVTIPVTIR